ncbi:hypothetical protein ACHQM5_022415 [Ranunculus cassubicifolius]
MPTSLDRKSAAAVAMMLLLMQASVMYYQYLRNRGRRGRKRKLRDDVDESIKDSLEKIVEAAKTVADALKPPDFEKMEEALEALPYVTETDRPRVMDLFRENPESAKWFFALNDDRRKLWLNRRLG